MKYKKKAQIDQLQGLVLALIVIGMVLVIGLLIFAQTKEHVVDLIDTTTTTNESYAYTNNTLAALTYSPTSITLSCVAVYNDSAHAETIVAGNYSCNTYGLNVTDMGDYAFNTTLYVTYSYKTADYAYNATGEVQNATQSIPGWLPIIVVVVIGGLLIGLVSFLRQQT